MPQDLAKANEFYLKAGELGCAEAYPRSYYDGRAVEVDKKKAKYYYELAAINGDIKARHNLGCMEGTAGNYHRAFKHLILAAKAGDKDSLDKVKEGFTEGFVTKEDSHKRRCDGPIGYVEGNKSRVTYPDIIIWLGYFI